MRVLIDAHMAGMGETGNETYVVGLLHALSRLPSVQCAAAVAAGQPLPPVLASSPIDVLPLRSTNNWERLAVGLPSLCRQWHADILHVSYTGPLCCPCPMVVAVHDVSFRRHPEFFSLRDRLLFRTLLAATLHRADAVITISASSQADIASFYPYTRPKLHRTYLAAGQRFRPMGKQVGQVCRQYGISRDFVLAVGNLQPRKNLERIILAFRQLLSSGQTDVQLVLAGKDEGLASHLQREAADLIESQQLVLTGYVPDEDLPALYNNARLLVYPSLYEGFGLPVLEAMACGTPVVTSDTSSLPEAAGDAALLVDPLQGDEIAQAMLRILTDARLALALSERGLRQASRFSWQRTAQETALVYQAVLDQQQGRKCA